MLGQNLKRGIVIQMDARLAGYTPEENMASKNDDMMQKVSGRIGLLGGEEFLYIPYERNQITYVETELDCISSRFTGCIMAVFIYNKKRCVAHVATPECNEKWIDLRKKVTDLIEFNPSRLFNEKNPLRVKAANETNFSGDTPASQSDCFGIIDRKNKKYGGFLVSTRMGARTGLSQHTVSSCVPVTS